jgi:hypothetical protein
MISCLLVYSQLRQIAGEKKILDIIEGNACGQEIKLTSLHQKYKKTDDNI